MISNRRVFAVVALCFATITAPAFAGGGSKRNPKLHVKNDSSGQVGIILNVDDAKLAEIASAGNPVAAFQSAGGKILNPGQKGTFSVKAGTQRVIAIDGDAVVVGEAEIEVEKGKDKTISFDGSEFK
ncbi:MAG: hypothetical protein Aurels2KO_51590 [Aureliella sp.]